MTEFRVSRSEQAAIERGWLLEDRAFKVLALIVAEFESDPASVACFDLRTVEEAKAVIRETRENDRSVGLFGKKRFPR